MRTYILNGAHITFMVEHLRALFSGGKSGESRNKCADRKEEAREAGRTNGPFGYKYGKGSLCSRSVHCLVDFIVIYGVAPRSDKF